MDDDVSKRFTDMENHIREAMTAKTSASMIMTATIYALQQGLQEACARLGVSEAQFLPRFQEAARWYYDHLMRTASDDAPKTVGEIDIRTEDQIPNAASPPRILPEARP